MAWWRILARRWPGILVCGLPLAATCARPGTAGNGAQARAVASAQPVTAAEAAATITAEEMAARIAFLASDALRGRETPSPGLDSAAAYLARAFEAAGLEPAGDSGTFFQRYPLPWARAVHDSSTPDAEAPPRPRRTGARAASRARGGALEGAYAPNVVALLPGADPALRDTYVVFSAHMDHVGTGAPDARGDSIYNGADDDASGTAALVEIAQAFATLSDRPARSLIFLAVSGEEKGLLGSRHFTEHPPVPIDRIVANLNLDMIGRNAPDTVVAIGQEYSTLGALVQEVARAHPELGLTVAPDLWPHERFFFRSDHFHFARKEIPALFFFAGIHEDYHRPSDEAGKIDADKAARIARLVFHLGHAIATRPEPPRWTAEGLEEVRALTR